MRTAALLLALVAALASGESVPQQLPAKDAIRLREFYRLEHRIQDRVWPGWDKAPSLLLLVTQQTEFLTHAEKQPRDFSKIGHDLYARARVFPVRLLATFPAFGPPSVIVVGEPENTEAKTSTPWLFTLMHEHFHQLQDGQPDFNAAVAKLGLAHGDNTGGWMLNYPFPYGDPEIDKSFSNLRDLLLGALEHEDSADFRQAAGRYIAARKSFFAQLRTDDAKYLDFQLWKEGIARYAQIKCAEAAAGYKPSRRYASLPDYESFAEYARHARADTLQELQRADLSQWKRTAVYSWGAAEGLLLDRIRPSWKRDYFKNMFTLDPYFNQPAAR